MVNWKRFKELFEDKVDDALLRTLYERMLREVLETLDDMIAVLHDYRRDYAAEWGGLYDNGEEDVRTTDPLTGNNMTGRVGGKRPKGA